MLKYAITQGSVEFDPAVHSVEDIDTLDLTIEQDDGDFAIATLSIINPRAPLPGDYVLISQNNELIFRGQISQAAVGMVEERLDIEAIGRTSDHENKRATLLGTLKTAPEYDPLFVAPEHRDDQAEVLTGHGKVLAWSRLTGDVQAVDPLSGATTIDLHPFRRSLEEDLSSDVPTSVSVDISVEWVQLVKQFHYLNNHFSGLESMTPDPLIEQWPKHGTEIGDGFRVSKSVIEADKKNKREVKYSQAPEDDELDLAWAEATTIERKAEVMPLNAELILMNLFELRRSEKVRLTLSAGVQDVLGETHEEMEPIRLQDLTEDTTNIPEWEPGKQYFAGDQARDGNLVIEALKDHVSSSFRFKNQWTTVSEGPAVNSRRIASFFRTSRGQDAILHAVQRMKARLRYASRAARLTFSCEMPANPNDLNENCMARVIHPGLPGGEATGRVVSYRLNWSGVKRQAEVTVAFALGDGTGTNTIEIGEPGGEIKRAYGRVRVKISNAGEEQETQFEDSGRISPTEIEIETVPAAMETLSQDVSVELTGDVLMPNQISWTTV